MIRGLSNYDWSIRSKNLLVYDDVRIQVYDKDKKAFHFWFNTFFIDRSGIFYINKGMIDGAQKDKKDVKFDKNFSIKVYMTQIEESRIGTWENNMLKEFKSAKLAKPKTKKLRTLEEGAAVAGNNS